MQINNILHLLQEHSKKSDRYVIVSEILLIQTGNSTGTSQNATFEHSEAPVPKELLDIFSNHACASTQESAQNLINGLVISSFLKSNF